jgi:hypothetical protein
LFVLVRVLVFICYVSKYYTVFDDSNKICKVADFSNPHSFSSSPPFFSSLAFSSWLLLSSDFFFLISFVPHQNYNMISQHIGMHTPKKKKSEKLKSSIFTKERTKF